MPAESDPKQTSWSNWLRTHNFAALYNLKEGLEDPFDALVWGPREEDRIAAWALYTELGTRITTQQLSYRAGDESTALQSVYQLFDLSRSTIKTHFRCSHFAALTIRILNTQVRPFTSKWHRMKVDGRLSSADVRFEFRLELAQLQLMLRDFTNLLGLLADDVAVSARAQLTPGSNHEESESADWAPLVFGVNAKLFGGEKFTELNAKEKSEVLARRAFYGFSREDEAFNATGLAISGGGIRSATFALGIVQTLARKGILRDVDFLSTVSGGGYLGAFISSFLNDSDKSASLNTDSGTLPFGSAGESEAQGVRHLRNHSKYLSEGGISTLLTIAFQVVYGVFVSLLLVGPVLLTGAIVVAVFFKNAFLNPTELSFLPAKLALMSLLFFVLVLPALQTFVKEPIVSRFWERATIALATLFAVLLLVGCLPHLFQATREFGGYVTLSGAVLFPVVLGVIGLWLGMNSLLGRIVFSLFGLSGPILFLATFFWLCELVSFSALLSLQVWAAVTLFLWIYSGLVLNINFASPHRYYRNRLARTYLTRSISSGAGVRVIDPQLLSTLNTSKKSPYHLINAAVNIPQCKDPNLRGRNTDFFLFSKHYCGSPIVGLFPTTSWEKNDKHLDLGTAMAISGAAAAPHMGTMTAPRYTFLLAMLNVRLGYWARRPLEVAKKGLPSFLPPVGWYYFFRELSGLMSEKTNFVNLSDGGHIENLGIYELLRRRCKFIIAIDGEADPKRSFGGLLTLTQLAKIDLGVTIEPELSDLRMDESGYGRAHFGMSRIDYLGGERGFLLYVKSSLTGNESEFIKKYRAENPDFPHESTSQQLYSESQFEAYRALGEHIAEDLFRRDLVGAWASTNRTQDWFKHLARHLL